MNTSQTDPPPRRTGGRLRSFKERSTCGSEEIVERRSARTPGPTGEPRAEKPLPSPRDSLARPQTSTHLIAWAHVCQERTRRPLAGLSRPRESLDAGGQGGIHSLVT